MSASRAGRVLRRVVWTVVAAGGLLVATAPPAAAHNVGSGNLPAPTWLLGYLGAMAVAVTAASLRAIWPAPRLARFAAAPPAAERELLGLHAGHAIGVVLLALALVAAIVGPDSAAANIAPVAVLVVWWVGLPIACLLAGDVMALLNPFVGVVRVLERGRADRGPTGAPAWVPAAFLAAFGWFFVAYHRPGSPRALAVFLGVYVVAALVAGLRWGTRWLATGEGFGALSSAVALLCPWRRPPAPAPGTAAVMVVWIGATAFDGFSSTPFWEDVVGSSLGWERTVRSTLGLIWLTAVVGGVYLAALWVAARRDGRAGDTSGEAAGDWTLADLATRLGVALVPLAFGWFLAHDLTLLLFEGQNFLALLSDPIGEGWDLLGTIGNTIDYGITEAWWVPWTQVLAAGVGHVVAVVIAHDTALRLLRRRQGMVVTWSFAGAAAVSIVALALLVLG